ncbi:MAG: EFR1 family ferrodoxin [Clostridia bacterium]|nr:EFR1 family ferrodoxin [Clostridia bacterium]
MRAIFYVFSGTGNTRMAAKEFADRLTDRGAETVVEAMERNATSSDEFDVIAICYPIHAFSAPEIVLEFVKKLPKIKKGGKKVFFLKTSGEPLGYNKSSSSRAKAILTRKGYDVTGEYWYVMPYNMLYRHYDSMATKMWCAAKRMIARDVTALLAGTRVHIRYGTPVSFLFRIVEQPFMKLNGRFFRVDKDKCVGCNLCVKNCPRDNIKVVDGKYTFGGNCIGCVRCSFSCPKDAIRIGIINFWKVNGKYTFGEVEPEVAECKYLKKAYEKYFEDNR